MRADTSEAASAEDAGWELAFEDDFEREELSDNWHAANGDWEIADGQLCGSGELLTTRGFPVDGPAGYQRLEFVAMTDVKPLAFLQVGDQKAKVKVSDLSAFLHVLPPDRIEDAVFETGYFFQFGGNHNKRNRICRMGSNLVVNEDADVVIEPDRKHHIVIENDAGTLRLIVDSRTLLEYEERTPLHDQHRHAGFYFYTKARVDHVKLYTKPASSKADDN